MLTLSPRQWSIVLAGTLIAGLLFIAATRVQPHAPAALPGSRGDVATAPAPLVNHPAPDFTLPDLAGTPVRLADLRGQVVLINVWATWCPPCRAEMPAIQAVYEQQRERGFTVLAVNVREDGPTVGAYMERSGLTFPALLDGDGAVSGAYRASVYPSSFFVDRDGIIRAVYRGPMARGVIAGTVEQLLVEEP